MKSTTRTTTAYTVAAASISAIAAVVILTVVLAHNNPSPLPPVEQIEEIYSQPPILIDLSIPSTDPTPQARAEEVKPTQPKPAPTSTRPPLPTFPTEMRETGGLNREKIITQYASCRDRYHGEEMQTRAEKAMSSLYSGKHTLQQIASITIIECPPVTTKNLAEVTAPDTTPDPTNEPYIERATQPTRLPSPTPSLLNSSAAKTPKPKTKTFDQVTNAKWLQQNNPKLAEEIADIPWITDGLTADEYQITEQLLHITAINEFDAARSLARMPFMQSPEPNDLNALKSLYRIASENKQQLREIIQRQKENQGIRNQDTPIISVMSSVTGELHVLEALQDQTKTTIHKSFARLPLAGEIELNVVRTKELGRTDTNQLIASSLVAAESIMAIEFPQKAINVLFTETPNSFTAGTNYGSHIAIQDKFDTNEPSQEYDHLHHLISHEIAHYYWNDNSNWIDEGMSDVMASLTRYMNEKGNPRRSRIDTTTEPCPYFKTIIELKLKDPNPTEIQYTCNYSLGERFFVAILRAVGDVEMRNSMRRLYDRSREIIPSGDDLDINDLSKEFQDDPRAQRVIRRWYYGTEPHDISRVDDSIPTGYIPQISAQIDAAYLSNEPKGKEIVDIQASTTTGWLYLVLEYKYDNQESRAAELQLIEYYEDGFQIRNRNFTITTKSGYIGGTYSLSVGIQPKHPQKPGHYRAMIYSEQTKVAEVEWEVTP